MNKYIKKYSILLIVLIAFQSLLQMLVLSQLQIILLDMGVEFEKLSSITNTILSAIPFLINIVLALVILKDLRINKIKGIPIVLLTVISHLAGVLFFLFIIHSQINSNDK